MDTLPAHIASMHAVRPLRRGVARRGAIAAPVVAAPDAAPAAATSAHRREACLRHGLNPEILRIRPLDSFAVAGVDPTVQRLRHETYTQRRFEMMRLVRAERKRLVAQEAREAELAAGGGGGGATITPQQIIAAQAKQNATFLDEEEKRPPPCGNML